jgi:glucokinase
MLPAGGVLRVQQGERTVLLAGDLGGTKTDLAIYSDESSLHNPVAEARYASADFPSLEAMCQDFLARVKTPVTAACFDVAGPVSEGRAAITNLPWLVDAQELRTTLGLRTVELLNDLQAIAHAIPLLAREDLHTLDAGVPAPHGALAVIAPGTGLGEAFATWDGAGYRAHPSEGGHADFAPADEAQIALLRFLHARFGHVSSERVCSGLGIPNLYDYLLASGFAAEDPAVAAALAAAPDRTRFILETALDAGAPSVLCRATLRMFVSILGAEAGNLALKVLATGGVYLAGGIPAHILPALHSAEFLEAIRRKGRFALLLEQVPVHVIVNPRVALLGAASYGLRMLSGQTHVSA